MAEGELVVLYQAGSTPEAHALRERLAEAGVTAVVRDEQVRTMVGGLPAGWSLASVVAVRTFSIRTGLVAVTVTPGSTAPEASRTTPEIPASCAQAGADIVRMERARPTHTRFALGIRLLEKSL